MRILLVKLSSLGDVVHTLPVVHDILAAMPQAQIDWVVEKPFAPLLTCIGGVHRVIPCELRRWRKSFWTQPTRMAWHAFKTDLQQDAYDAVIDLQGLTKSAVMARLARLTPGGKRYAMANQTEGSAYEAPTRWLAHVAMEIKPHVHAVQRGRELAARALGYSVSAAAVYALKPSPAQSNRAQAAPETIAFIHGTSRPDKTWPTENWIELAKRLQGCGCQVALIHGSAQELATSQAIAQATGAAVWPLMPLDALTQQLGQCAGAIGVDSGVSHIAVALDLPHVQIYNFDTAWRTGPGSDPTGLGRHQASVYAQPNPGVEAVWQAWLHCRAGCEGRSP